MKKITQYSWVVFDKENCPEDVYDELFKNTFEHENGSPKKFVFLGESPQVKGHCLIADIETGLIGGLYHIDNFREAIDDEFSFSFEISMVENE